MAKLTRDQLNKMESKMGNPWKFDIQKYVIWNEKQAHIVFISDIHTGKAVEIVCSQIPQYEGEGYRRKLIGYRLGLEATKLEGGASYDENAECNCYRQTDLFPDVIGELKPRRSFSEIQKFTRDHGGEDALRYINTALERAGYPTVNSL